MPYYKMRFILQLPSNNVHSPSLKKGGKKLHLDSAIQQLNDLPIWDCQKHLTIRSKRLKKYCLIFYHY